jgi:hypothetical protein
MSIKISFLTLLAVGVMILAGCGSPLADGTLNGEVIRESDGTVVKNAAVIVGRVHQSVLMPAQSFITGPDGKFSIIVGGGNYNIQISTKEAGPYFMWPDVVYIAPNETSKIVLVLPPGY